MMAEGSFADWQSGSPYPDCQQYPHAEVDCAGDDEVDHDPGRDLAPISGAYSR